MSYVHLHVCLFAFSMVTYSGTIIYNKVTECFLKVLFLPCGPTCYMVKLSSNDVLLSDIFLSIMNTLPCCIAVCSLLLTDVFYVHVCISSCADNKSKHLSCCEAFILFMDNINRAKTNAMYSLLLPRIF